MPNYRALTLTFTCNSSERVKLFFLSLFFDIRFLLFVSAAFVVVAVAVAAAPVVL